MKVWYLSYSTGFTLLEVLVALVVAAILAVVVMPNFEPLLEHARLRSTTRDIASGLRHVRGQALLRGKESVFELNTDHHYYRVTGRSKMYSLSDSVHLTLYTSDSEVVSEGMGRIRFFPDGSATGGRITIETNGQKQEVDISWLTGEVKIRTEVDE